MKSTMSIRLFFATGLALLSLACSSTLSENKQDLDKREAGNQFVRVTLDRESYHRGDTVVVTIRNITGGNLGYNFCPTFLEKRVDGKWKRVVDPKLPEHWACTMELYSLPQRESTTVRFFLDSYVTKGTHHLLIPSPVPSTGNFISPSPLVTNSFVVETE